MESTDAESQENIHVNHQVPKRSEPTPPELSDGQLYHVFVSYSSTDLQWTHDLIQQLEDRGLRVCFHDRDFTPGRPILENMSECISQSQKVLLVLSQDFVKSLLEANMSMFRDCLQRKPIVPVLLQRDLSIPLALAHLTYLELSHPDFTEQLLRVLCTPNDQLHNSTMVPYQPPNIYNGKILQPLLPIDEVSRFVCGVWSTEVPQHLHLLIQDKNLYKTAIQIINRVHQEKLRSWWKTGLIIIFLYLAFMYCFITPTPQHRAKQILVQDRQNVWRKQFVFENESMSEYLFRMIRALVFFSLLCYVFYLIYVEPKRIIRELQTAVCEANILLCQENILIGAWTKSDLHLVYVSLDSCKCKITEQFPENNVFDKALLKLSSGYACWLTKKHFSLELTDNGHLEGSVCFCQYVFQELES